MNRNVLVKRYILPKINNEEVLRYMGVKVCDDMTGKLVKECIEICDSDSVFLPNVCCLVCDLDIRNEKLLFDDIKVESMSLSRHLAGCNRAVLFAATVGVGIDRLIEKYSRLSASKALCFNAIGAQRIEDLCDLFCDDIKKDYSEYSHTLRFSPGYGDFDIGFQKDIFKLLNCPKNIGLSLCDSFIMSPSKSVTAIIGLKSKELTE
ncbi:MAG: Vitamin B12 dependent methionine synthase activation subunit [Ruminococcaceae bacterium]|nr:Vitamin B12 dependent methionine synthase activation subunit [Oscillospiraceae bacterium]